MNRLAAGELKERLRIWFPEREFFMRSQGQVRFIKIGTKLQAAAAALAALLLLAWLATMAGVAINHVLSTRDRLALLDREAKVTSAESRVSAYRSNLDKVAQDLERRQDFLQQVTEASLGKLPADAKSGETVSNSTEEAARTVKKVSMVLPEATNLARIEARQLAFVESLTRLADRRAQKAMASIRRLGLDPRMMLASLEDRSAQGGPLIAMSTTADGAMDPRFARLGLSLARMNALQRGLAGVPQHLPASLEFISSGFGYRTDPFTGAGAFHAGLDFRGPIGAPIYAAAKGVIRFAGQRSGYGNCIEIDHGNGLVTRYAHMSAFRARLGQRVRAGDVIGEIGSTGRSTGPHLHFEVRIHDQPVDPRPFLEAATHVLKEDRDNRPADGQANG